MTHLSNEDEKKNCAKALKPCKSLRCGTVGCAHPGGHPPSILSLQVEDGRYLIQVARAPALDGDLAKTERLAIETVLPEAFFLQSTFGRHDGANTALVGAGLFKYCLFFAFLLWWDLRKIRWLFSAATCFSRVAGLSAPYAGCAFLSTCS